MTDAKPYMDICEQLSRENSLLRDANANLEQGLEIKQRFIAVLEHTIDTLYLKVKTLQAELAEYKDLVGTHEEQP